MSETTAVYQISDMNEYQRIATFQNEQQAIAAFEDLMDAIAEGRNYVSFD